MEHLKYVENNTRGRIIWKQLFNISIMFVEIFHLYPFGHGDMLVSQDKILDAKYQILDANGRILNTRC